MSLTLRVILVVLGVAAAGWTAMSAIRTFVLPRSSPVMISRVVFKISRGLFELAMFPRRTYEGKDRILALFAPVTLLVLPAVWLLIYLIGFTGIYLGLGVEPWREALDVSGSSLLTLGYARPHGLASTLVSFGEAALGFGSLALLLTYLPSIYSAFSRREAEVAKLEVRAGSPPSAVELITRLNVIQYVDSDNEIWPAWESWFVDIEESHTSLGALAFFRSPQPHHHWVVAAAAVLDAAAFRAAVLYLPPAPHAQLCLRAGYIALRRICEFFSLDVPSDPAPTDPISIQRHEFDSACAELQTAGIRLRNDRNQAWMDFAGWRVNYDQSIIALSRLTMAPSARWSSDRLV